VVTALSSSPASIPKLLPLAAGRAPEKKRAHQGNITVVKVEPSARPSLPIRRSSRLQSVKDTISTMPSFLRHSRSYSFPPCIDDVVIASSSSPTLEDIDENPFAHFLTPVNDEDNPYDGMSMSAGIQDGPRSSKASKFKSTVADKWARYVKTNHVQLHSHYHEEESTDDDDESFMTLDDNRLFDQPHTVSQLTGPPSPRITITEPTRGRPQDLAARKTRNRRRYSRTLSGHRHSWREPSPDLFTVEESEEEEIMIPLRRTKTKKMTKDGVERRRSSKNEVAERSRL
jgi:hypothetical protein